MTKQVICAGFGGQGVLAIGKTLAEVAMSEGNHVSWLPSYGPEMRGGTANCAVVISAEPIISPLIDSPTELIAMNLPSLRKFETNVAKDGMIFINTSIVTEESTREDITVHKVPCLEIANELGNEKVSNMVMLGAYIEATKFMSFDTVVEILKHMFTGKKAALIELNKMALKKGAECVSK